MKIIDIILESIQAPLYDMGYEAIQQGLPDWLNRSINLLDEYTEKHKYYNSVKGLNDEGYGEERAKLRDDQYQLEYDTLVKEDDPYLHTKLVNSLKEMLEKQLRQQSMSYIESQFGKVGKIVPKEPYEEMKKRHLYWLQFVAVDIDTKAKSKSGKRITSGGYFTHTPAKDQMKDKWSQENVDWGNELGSGIKIYTSENSIWLGGIAILINHLQEEHFGETIERATGFEDLLRKILGVWVHETIHLEQHTRRYLLDKINYKYDWGLTYTPQDKKRPKFPVYDKETGKQKKENRGGTRGFPSHLTDLENIQMGEWIEYFGTAHEIEAHAGGAAAQIIHDANITANYIYDKNDKQRRINSYINDIIQDISYGIIDRDVSSLRDYYDHIRNEAMRYLRLKNPHIDRDIKRDPRILNKVNFGARKVWKIFLTKLVKHLEGYKRPVKDWSDRDTRLRTLPIPKPQLPG